MTNTIKTNFVYQIAYRILTILTPLITSPILSRALGAEKLGVYSATLALVSYFMLIAMLGAENYGIRSIAEAQGDRKRMQTLFWNIYAVQLVTSVLAMMLYLIAFLFIQRERYLISAIQGIWLVGCLLNINWFFFGTERFRLTVTRNILIKILTVILIVLLVHRPEDLYIYALIMAGDTLLSNLVVWPFLYREIAFEWPKWEEMRRHISPIFVLFVPILAMSVFHVMDKTMLDWLSTEANVGYYYSADKVINIPLAVITAIGTVMLPRVANVYSGKDMPKVRSMLRKSSELTLFLSCAVGFGLAAIAKEFIPFFFGAGYEPCIRLVYWFVPILFFKAVGDLVRTQFMIPSHKDRVYTLAVCCGASVNLIFNMLFITRYGALGAVWGTLLAELAVTIFQLICTRKEVPFFAYVRQSWTYLAFGAAMLVGVRAAAGAIRAPIFIKLLCMICLGAVIYMVCCVLYWKISKKSVFASFSVKTVLTECRLRGE